MHVFVFYNDSSFLLNKMTIINVKLTQYEVKLLVNHVTTVVTEYFKS